MKPNFIKQFKDSIKSILIDKDAIIISFNNGDTITIKNGELIIKQYPPCFSCKYYWEDQGTGDGCLKVINKYNPFKRNIYNYSRCNNRMRNNEFCEYYKKRLKLNKIL